MAYTMSVGTEVGMSRHVTEVGISRHVTADEISRHVTEVGMNRHVPDVRDPNRVDVADPRTDWSMEKALWLYAVPFLLVIGISGNLFSVFTVLDQSSIRKTGELIAS